MFKNRKTRLATLLIGAGIAIASAQTFAFGPGQGGHCGGFGPKGGEYGQERFSQRYKQRLHDALKLTPQQETAWSKFQESHPFAGKAKRPDPVDMTKLTAPERAEKMLELQKQHQDAMGKHVVAMKDFYAQLTPEQKKTFDEQTQMGKRGQRGGMRGPGPQGPATPPPAN